MKACFGLLLDYRMDNLARKMIFDISKKYDVEISNSNFSQYIIASPKIEVEDLSKMEVFLDSIAEKTQPLNVNIEGFALKSVKENNDEYTALTMNISENEELIDLYNSICTELQNSIDKLNMEGCDFNSMVAKVSKNINGNEEILEEVNKNMIDQKYVINEMALLYTDDDNSLVPNIYKTLPLFGYKEYVCL